MELNFFLMVVSTVIANACFSGTVNAGNALVLGLNVRVVLVDPIIHIANRDADYNEENNHYTGLEILSPYFWPLCDEAAKSLDDRTLDRREQPNFGAYSVTFSDNPLADAIHYNLLMCPATPKEYYIRKWQSEDYTVFRRYAGSAIQLGLQLQVLANNE